MKQRRTEVNMVSLRASLGALLMPRWTLSYIGAGTGSLIIQVVIAALAGGLIALKLYWSKVKALFQRDGGAGEAGGTACVTAEPPREGAGVEPSLEEELLPAVEAVGAAPEEAASAAGPGERE